MNDIELLREFTERDSEAAFAGIVARHVDKVYSVALRRTRNPHEAEEITQAVFVIFARKAGALASGVSLAGWFYKTAQITARTFIRGEARRAQREQEAFMQTLTDNPPTDPAWEQIAPLLDTAMERLNEKDRHAIVLRFFDGKSMGEIGVALGASEAAAKKRVGRALKKLHRFFTRHGVTSTTEILAGAMRANSVQAAPAGLAKAISAVALTKGAAVSTSTLTLIKGTLKIMAWTKAKTVIIAGAVIILLPAATIVTVKQYQEHRTPQWQKDFTRMEYAFDVNTFKKQPDGLCMIAPAKKDWRGKGGGFSWDGRMGGVGMLASEVIAGVCEATPARSIFPEQIKLSTDRYDYIATLLGGWETNQDALQKEAMKKFGVDVKIETRPLNAMLLRVKTPNATALKIYSGNEGGNWNVSERDRFIYRREMMGNLALNMEWWSGVPIVDETGLTNRYDFDLEYTSTDMQSRNWDKINAGLNKVGLELVPTNMPLEVLVVEKAK